MPGESLIVVDGFIRTLPDGSLVTDKDGAPCCCGGGCCFCSDLAAGPGEKCYDPYQPGTCGPPKCCCGRAWEWAMKIATRYEKPDGSWRTVDMDLLARIDIEGENCVRKVTSLRSTWRGRTSGGYDKELLNTKLVFTGNQFNSTSFYCRVTPTCAAECVGTASDGTFPISPGLDTGDLKANVFQPPCSGERVSGFQTFTWASEGNCNSGRLDYREVWDSAGTNNDYTATVEAEWSVNRLDAKCCGPGPVLTLVPSGPVNPADPGTPSGLMYGCPACGAAFNGEKCYRCGYCQGCGG